MTTLRESIRQFVQGTLGCGCEDAVFADIELTRPEPGTGGPQLQLVIGGRLLVRVYTVAAGLMGDGLEAVVAGWVAEGVDRRDVRGLNRFRLVLCPAVEMEAPLRAALLRFVPPDERVHLHVLTAA